MTIFREPFDLNSLYKIALEHIGFFVCLFVCFWVGPSESVIFYLWLYTERSGKSRTGQQKAKPDDYIILHRKCIYNNFGRLLLWDFPLIIIDKYFWCYLFILDLIDF